MRPRPFATSAEYLRQVCAALRGSTEKWSALPTKKNRSDTLNRFWTATANRFGLLWRFVRAATIWFVTVFWIALICAGTVAGLSWWLGQGIPVAGLGATWVNDEPADKYVVGQYYDEAVPMDGKLVPVHVRYMGKLAPGERVETVALGDSTGIGATSGSGWRLGSGSILDREHLTELGCCSACV
jgi:hypothetical protein